MRRPNGAVTRIMQFLRDKDIVTVTDYMEPAHARAHGRVRARGNA